MLKQSIGIGMLCIAGHAYSADITVTTLEDVSHEDKECSLREAIEFVNLGLPKEGYQGCGGGEEEFNTTIVLKQKEVYELKSKLHIKASLVIQTSYNTDVNERVIQGTRNAKIRMTGNEQIFYIDDEDENKLSAIFLKEVSLEGCKTDQCQQQKGGLIYNREDLSLDYAHLDGGRAVLGGAIYNAGADTTNLANNGFIEIRYSLIENNHANEGGIIYSQLPRFRIENSVLRHNQTQQHSALSANIYTENIFASKYTFPFKHAYILSSTLYGNTGAVVLIRNGIGVNSSTIVANTKGIHFDVQDENHGYVTNSILLGNPHGAIHPQDCGFSDTDQSIQQNNLTGDSCGSGDPIYMNQNWSSSKIIAGNNIEGQCASFNADNTGILCPYREVDGQFLGYFRPRMLPSYINLDESPILNKGRNLVDKAPIQFCELSDQRLSPRDSNYALCDRGAIEVIIPTSLGLVGQDLYMGETARISILDKLGDSDLLPKEYCADLVGQHPKGEAWQDGCFVIEQQPHVTSKGVTTLDELGNLVYQPNGNWHGADLFTLKVITTTTKFDKNNPYLNIRVNIVQEPKGEMPSSKIKTSGGSMGFWSLFGLLALVTGRRLKK